MNNNTETRPGFQMQVTLGYTFGKAILAKSRPDDLVPVGSTNEGPADDAVLHACGSA